MAKNEKKQIKLLGAFVEGEFVDNFREYCKKNDFKQTTLFQRLVEWWLALSPMDQEHIYRGRLQEVGNIVKSSRKIEPTVSESIETLKTFIRYKIPSAEEQREIESLRQALGAEPKKERKRKRG